MIKIFHYPDNKREIIENFDKFKLNLWEIESEILPIIQDVIKNGDNAVRKYTKKFDNVDIQNLEVTKKEIEEAYNNTSEEIKTALKLAAENIHKFHLHQLEKQKEFAIVKQDEFVLTQRNIPVESAGLYIPGGKAPYPSTVLMTAIPAKVAGVKNVVLITPPDKKGKVNPIVLTAAKICKVDRIFKVGGVQGIAALAFGTQTIPKVDVIVGPGNKYVTAAKKILFGQINIDMIAGPSEIMVIADDKTNTKYIAADLLSQAEHDEIATSILITFSEKKAKEVLAEIKKQIQNLSRKETIQKSLSNCGMIIIVNSKEDAIKLINKKAPEHLEIMTEDNQSYIKHIKNAGAIFLGEYTPEPVGDYFAGPNHTLPTSGTARFFSPLGTYHFIKKTNIIYYSAKRLKKAGKYIEILADCEGFTAHKNAITVRLEDLK